MSLEPACDALQGGWDSIPAHKMAAGQASAEESRCEEGAKRGGCGASKRRRLSEGCGGMVRASGEEEEVDEGNSCWGVAGGRGPEEHARAREGLQRDEQAPRAQLGPGDGSGSAADNDADDARDVGSVTEEGGRGEKVVLHLDVDSFYCAVELKDDPSLRGVPIGAASFLMGCGPSVWLLNMRPRVF
jgi:hypothetical protein